MIFHMGSSFYMPLNGVLTYEKGLKMSRSYRHHVWFSYEGDKRDKKLANRRVRRSKDIYQNGDYKKVYPSWLISLGKIGYSCENSFVRENVRYGANEEVSRKVYRKYLLAK